MEIPTGGECEGHLMNNTGSFPPGLVPVASRELFRLIKMSLKEQSLTGKTMQLGSPTGPLWPVPLVSY